MASADRKVEDTFKEYCSKEGQMTSKDMTKLFTDAKVMKKTGPMSSNSLDISFSKHKPKGKNVMGFKEFDCLLKDVCKGDYDAVCCKLKDCKKDDHLKTKTSKTGGVDRLTDASKYTGSHKERFDASGKGKGKDGRVEKVDDSGYVGNYQGEGTYDKK